MIKNDTMKQMVTCGIHLEQMNDPITLKCQHTFCRGKKE